MHQSNVKLKLHSITNLNNEDQTKPGDPPQPHHVLLSYGIQMSPIQPVSSTFHEFQCTSRPSQIIIKGC